MNEANIMKEFDGLVCRLSPENLCCDGEISRVQINARRAQIQLEWALLEAALGRKMSYDQAEAHCFAF